MKRVIFFLCFSWALWGGLSLWMAHRQKGERNRRADQIMESLAQDPALKDREILLPQFRRLVPFFERDPHLLRSYEVLLSLPDSPRSFWFETIKRLDSNIGLK